MTEEEMVHQSVQAMTELDQDSMSDSKAVGAMMRQCGTLAGRYPAGHPIRLALDEAIQALMNAWGAFNPYLPAVFAWKDGDDAPPS